MRTPPPPVFTELRPSPWPDCCCWGLDPNDMDSHHSHKILRPQVTGGALKGEGALPRRIPNIKGSSWQLTQYRINSELWAPPTKRGKYKLTEDQRRVTWIHPFIQQVSMKNLLCQGTLPFSRDLRWYGRGRQVEWWPERFSYQKLLKCV